MVDALDRRDRTHGASTLDDVPSSDQAFRAIKPATPRTYEPSAANDAYLLEVVRQAAQQVKYTCHVDPATDRSKPAPPRGPSNDDVAYIGTNSGSVDGEVQALRKMLGKHVAAVDATKGSTITRNGVDYDLQSPEGRKRFIATLGLPPKIAAKLETLITPDRYTPKEAIAIAHLAMTWAPAETSNAAIPSRLILSGHSLTGSSVGGIRLSVVRELASLMPKAACQIEDICLAACSSAVNAGGDQKEWSKAFPNLKTLWSYNGSAPSPGTAHFGAWIAATAGRKDDIRLTSDLAKANVAVWSKSSGYRDRNESLTSLLTRARASDTRYAALVDGSIVPKHSHEQPYDADYRTYRKLAQHKGLTAEQRADYQAKADAINRVRLYPQYRTLFVEEHGAKIKRAFEAVGLPVPDFDKLSLKEAIAQVALLKEKLKTNESASREVGELVNGKLDSFVKLRPDAVSNERLEQ